MKGTFISVEGTDGAGKSTQINLIKKYFNDNNIEAVFLREPGGTQIGEKIRSVILDPKNIKMSAKSEALLYAASRAQLAYEVIIPAVKNGKTVVCDRFFDSSIAYQGYGRGLGYDMVFNINKYALDGLEPDITLFFDLPPEKGILRKKEQKSFDRMEMENMDFHNKVYKGYMELCQRFPERIKRIDASLTVEEVFEKVKSLLSEVIK